MSAGHAQWAVGRVPMCGSRPLLLDEPSMGLAPLFVEEIFAIIATLKADGTTILLMEQNASAALDVADHASVLGTGRIVLSGPASDVVDNSVVATAYLDRLSGRLRTSPSQQIVVLKQALSTRIAGWPS